MKSQVVAAYLARTKTVEEICSEFCVARRSVYLWLKQSGHVAHRGYVRNRQSFYVSREEIMLLRRLLQANVPLSREETNTAMLLDDRLVTALNKLDAEENGEP